MTLPPSKPAPCEMSTHNIKIANVQSMPTLVEEFWRGLPKAHILRLGQVSSCPLEHIYMVSKNRSFLLARLDVPLNNSGKEI